MTGVLRRLNSNATKPAASQGPFWPDTKRLIDEGIVTPIVSNQVTAAVFGVDTTELVKEWARQYVHSPLSDEENGSLARVAQYYSIQIKDVVEAKRLYLEALKEFLVAGAEADRADPDLLDQYKDETERQKVSFSDLAWQFHYPRYADASQNPLRLLAELPLPIYLTTSHHQLLQHALLQTNSKHPVTEIFYWHDGLKRIPSVFDSGYVPSVERPLVYHLFGLDKYPESLVLTEDDHLDYLVRLSSASHEVKLADKKMDIPTNVSLALSSTALLLLGYQVYDWDFRVLFKGLVQGTRDPRSKITPKSISMQIEPKAAEDEDKSEQIKSYLTQFFEQSHFDIYWGDLPGCVRNLWQLWKGR